MAARPRQILGKNVNRLRMTLNLTQEELSDRAQIDRRQLQRIEAGTAYVPGNVTLPLSVT